MIQGDIREVHSEHPSNVFWGAGTSSIGVNSFKWAESASAAALAVATIVIPTVDSFFSGRGARTVWDSVSENCSAKGYNELDCFNEFKVDGLHSEPPSFTSHCSGTVLCHSKRYSQTVLWVWYHQYEGVEIEGISSIASPCFVSILQSEQTVY